MKFSDLVHTRPAAEKSNPAFSTRRKSPSSSEELKSEYPKIINQNEPLENRADSSQNCSENAETVKVYGGLIKLTRAFLSGFSKIPVSLPDLEELCEGIERSMEIMETEPYKLLELTERSTPGDYLPGHTANVTLLTIALSKHCGWPKEVQRAVAMGALFHDIGMVFHRPTADQMELITAEKRQTLRRVPETGLEILGHFLSSLSPESKKIVGNIILQTQERISGDGYPHKLKGDQISKEAQAVGLCDTYESITHPRPYRARKLPHETMKYLMGLSGELFDASLMKSFCETLTFFPPGSFVKLDSGETAQVAALNKKLPTRPVLRVVLSANGEANLKEKIIDLAQTPGLSIEKAVDECALDAVDPKTLLEFRVQKWWIE